MKKSFIETDFPIKEVSGESTREKFIRHGHISTLHIWWARRPLASSRASIYAALTPEPANDKDRLNRLHFVGAFTPKYQEWWSGDRKRKAPREVLQDHCLARWENSLNQRVIDEARKHILDSHEGTAPKVLDQFAGGGAIPLEALRLGCETYASDLNPVAVLLEKALLQYPQRYSRDHDRTIRDLGGQKATNPLLEDVERWGNWVASGAKKEIGKYYPADKDGSVTVGYLWAWTVRCQNPNCETDVPLMRQTWLAKREKKRVAYRIIPKGKKIEFAVREGEAIDFDPGAGLVSRGKAVCPCCGAGLSGEEIKLQFRNGKAGQRMIAVISHRCENQGKNYRLATDRDLRAFREAKRYLDHKRKQLTEKWSFDPVPDEPGPPKNSHRAVSSQLPVYGFQRWGDLFNPRQKLSLITIAGEVKEAYKEMLATGYDAEYAKVVTTYLAIALNRVLTFSSILARIDNTRETISNMFNRQAFAMVWDYAESNPFSNATGDWNSALKWILKVIDHCSKSSSTTANVVQTSATSLHWPDESFDAVITDPPYYDNVPYSDLSDFFYVWMKRTVGDLHPELFSTPLTPKAEEIIQNSPRQGGYEKAKCFFETMISKAFSETYRVLKSEGIACIVFAHKSTDAWESVIKALLESGLYLTASWPVHTEMTSRLTAKETASLASSIYMVCRKRTEKRTVYFNEIKPQIEARVKEKLDQFWTEGIGGSDFFISAIGPAMEVFGKYESVEKLSGDKVSARELLEYVREVVSAYALSKILKKPELSGIDEETRFYLLWRWTFNSKKVHFDDARKLAQAVGIEITEEWGNGFIKKEKEYISVLSAKDRGKRFLSREHFDGMLDVLHASLLYWEKNYRGAIAQLLDQTGYLNNSDFWRVAQSISDVLPDGDKEKQMLQGFLYGKESYSKQEKKRASTQEEFEL